MESQQIAPHHQSVVEGEEDGQHHEKKSVLKKVKAKAKKIKDTITKHGHHDHDQDDEEDDDNIDDEDEGVVEDPDLQGAPLYEGAAMRSGVGGGQGQHQDVGIGMSTPMMQNQPPPTSTPISRDNSAVAPNTTMSLSPWSFEEDPHAPNDKTHPQHSHVKASDPAQRGSEEAGDSQIFDSFAKMKVNEDDEPDRNKSRYVQKISAVGSAMSGKAVAAKDFMAWKLGYGERTEEKTNRKSSSALEYGKKIALTVTEKLKPGEEDRALSEAISEAFNRRKEEGQPKGKVTESEEVTRRLGREENEGTERSSATATVKSVADMVKDTVGSWMGKTQGVEGFTDSSAVGEGQRRREPGGTEAEVRMLQESAN